MLLSTIPSHSLRHNTPFAAHHLQRFLTENRCKVPNKYCCPSYRLSLSPNQQPPPLSKLQIWAFFELEITQNSIKFDQIFYSLLFTFSTINFSAIFSQTKWVMEADRSGWLERVRSGQRQAGPRQQQTIPSSGAQRAAASVKVNFWNL
jgi:hypothetical protein